MPTDPQSPRPDAAHGPGRRGPPPPGETAHPLDATEAAGAGGPALTLAPGMKPVADYKLVRVLGRGAFGEVWEATGPGGFPVAMKFLRLADGGADAEKRALKLMQGLRHPNLLALFGAWRNGDFLIVAMELADRTLHDRFTEALNQGKRGIPQAELLPYMRQAAAGLDYLNGQGVQHRDIKPANLLLVGGGVKVGDFGLARLLEKTVQSVSHAMTPAYAAPEFVNGQATRWSDQYSLAVVYCQLRGGKLPFEGNVAALLAGHLMKAPDLGMLPAAERSAVAWALAKKPERRWPSCTAFVEALASGAAQPASLPRPQPPKGKSPPAPRPRPKKARRPWFWPVAACLLGLLASGGLATFLWQYSGDQNVPPTAARIENSVGMKLVRIGAGKFRMGSPATEEARDPADKGSEEQHDVEIAKPFYLGAHEVTQAQYQKIIGKNPSNWSPEGAGKVQKIDTRDFPVESVSWEDAVKFCALLSELPAERKAGRVYQLPTEAEWEYACRGGPVSSPAPFHFLKPSASLSFGQANFWAEHPYGGGAKGAWLQRTCRVGSYEPNRLELYDMHGNVWEWCADWYDKDYYRNSPLRDPQGPKASPENRRVLRGGSGWFSGAWCRAAMRNKSDPGERNFNVGLRVVFRPGARTP